MTAPRLWDVDWISGVDARRILGISQRPLRRLVEDGVLRLGDRPTRRYSRRQVEALAAAQAEWIGASEAAIILGVTRTRVGQLSRKGFLPFDTFRGKRRYRRDQIQVVANARLARWHDGIGVSRGQG